MTTLLIVNPYCRGGDVDTGEIEQVLAQAGPMTVFRLGEGEIIDSPITRIGADLERIVVAGGDGTLHGVLPAIVDAGVPLGVIPLGTANDFARTLELPADPVAAARTITGNVTRRVDVGVVNDRYFLNAVGVGLGPELTRRMDRDKKKRLGVLAYLQSLIQVIGQRRLRFARLVVDGRREWVSFLQITVANGRHYGGGMLVSDEAALDDSLLHVLCVRPLTPAQLVLRAVRLRSGTIGDDEKLLCRKGQSVRIETAVDCDATADGELVARTPLDCRTLSGAIEVYVPATAACRHENAAQPATASKTKPFVHAARQRAPVNTAIFTNPRQ